MNSIYNYKDAQKILTVPQTNPLTMNRPPYYRIPASHIENNEEFAYMPIKAHLAEVIKIISKVHGNATDYCVLAGNVIGVGNWSKLNVKDQHHYVTQKAGAFVASGMMYLNISGDDAVNLLNYLTPRDISKMPINSALFVLFTSHSGGIDEEAVILRLSKNEFLLSCGGGKAPSFVHEGLALFPNVSVRDVDTVSFNIKGPMRQEAMCRLIDDKDKAQVLGLKKFSFCTVKTVNGDEVHVARTIIGMEMWGESSAISRVWEVILKESDIIMPCGWNLLETYRMECKEICFALHPLDMNYSTTVRDVGLGWMIDSDKEADYIGKRYLAQSKSKQDYELVKIYATPGASESPTIGERLIDNEGVECGYITSGGYSYQHNRYIAFAHLTSRGCDTDAVYSVAGSEWRNNLDTEQSMQPIPFDGMRNSIAGELPASH